MAERRHSTHRTIPSLEQLETRLTPSDAGFVTASYKYLLHRSPGFEPNGTNELTYWVNQIPFIGREGVALSIWQSPEHRVVEVTSYYELYLKRAPDATGLNFWVAAMTIGTIPPGIPPGLPPIYPYQGRQLSEDEVQEDFIQSAEYQANHSTTTNGTQALNPKAFVQDLYKEVLFRPGSASEVNNWVNFLTANGTDPNSVSLTVLSFFTSTERYLGPDAPKFAEGIDPFYRDLLKRAPSPAEQALWLGFLTKPANGTLQGVGILILSSPEFDSLNP